jgi:hypothetical protein
MLFQHPSGEINNARPKKLAIQTLEMHAGKSAAFAKRLAAVAIAPPAHSKSHDAPLHFAR